MKTFTRVLIVDDENIFRNILRNMIPWEDKGFLVVGFAENGRQALSLLGATAPQIVITDVAMPVMNGVELLAEIKKRNESGHPPIETIVISGFDTFSYVRDAMKNGAFDYILKSELTAQTLLQRLENLAACLPQPKESASRLELSLFFDNLLNGSYSNPAFVQQELHSYGLALELERPLFLIRSFCADKSEEYLQASDARRALLGALRGLPVAVFLHQGACMLLGDMAVLEPVLAQVTGQGEEYPALYWGVFRDFPVLESSRKLLGGFAQIPQQFFYAPTRKVFFVLPGLQYENTAQIDTSYVISAVARGDSQAVVSYLGDFLARCVTERISPYAVKRFCEQSIHTILYAMEKAAQDTTGLNARKIEFFRRIDLAATIDELCDVLDGVLEDVFAGGQADGEPSRALIAAIDQFVAENYMRPLRLSDIADHVHVSYHHLSRVMNAHYREPFNDYLNRIRIQAAQSLIRTSSLSLGRIAEEVGFANQSYFGKVFKKLVAPRLVSTVCRLRRKNPDQPAAFPAAPAAGMPLPRFSSRPPSRRQKGRPMPCPLFP